MLRPPRRPEKESSVPVAADYPFLDFFWSMLLIFLWIAWIFILLRIIIDVFRRDESGLKKTAWVIFLIFIPFLGVLVYLIVNGGGMTRRDIEQSQAAQAQMDSYIRQTAGGGGGSAAEIAKAKELLDSGAITQAEFDQIKQKALG
jgi:predicted PurR-regulated permease PerM